MLARLQQLIVLFLAALVAGTWIYAGQLGRPLWAPVTLLAIVAGYAGILGLEFRLLRRSYQDDDPSRPRAGQLLRSWRDEVLIAPRVFLWQQPFRSNRFPDYLPTTAHGRRGVIFVHGFFCNRGLWDRWLNRFCARGIPFVAVNLEPVFGSISDYVGTIEAAVRRMEAVTGRPPLLVSHSMGGLAVRAWLARPDSVSRFHRVVTIGSPHRGTWMARHGRTTNSLEMKQESPWLVRLARSESPELYKRFTCFWSHCDNIVFPTSSATLPGADNRHLAATPHVAMVFHPAVFEEVMRLTGAE